MPIAWDQIALLARLADDAYSTTGLGIQTARSPLSQRLEPGWTLLGPSQVNFAGAVYVEGYFEFDLGLNDFALFLTENSNGDIVLSIRGTDQFRDFSDYPALGTLIYTLVDEMSSFLESAFVFVQQRRLINPDLQFLITGHSLGGALAEAIAIENPGIFQGGIFVGSPGSLGFGLSETLSSSFIHLSRTQDPVGALLSISHAANTIWIDDFDFLTIYPIIVPGETHSYVRYASQAAQIAASPFNDILVGGEFEIAFLPSHSAYEIEAGSFVAFHGTDRIVFGYSGAWDDRITIASGAGPLWADGGGGADTLIGGESDDILSGGFGADNLEGRAGSDRLFGGGQGDRYHIGVNQGYDIIDDRGGGSGLDALVLYAGSVASVFDYNWFTRDGSDLLVRIPNGGGGYHIDVRIKNMGTTGGGIERVELWAGEGTTQTNAWDLAALWAGLTQPVVDTPNLPTPTAPSSGFTTGNGTIAINGASLSGGASEDSDVTP